MKTIWFEDRGTQKFLAKFQLFQDKLQKCWKLSNYSSTNTTTTICRNRLFICHYFSKVPWQTFPSVNKSGMRIVKWPARSLSLLWMMKSHSGIYHYYSVLQPLFSHLCWQTTVVFVSICTRRLLPAMPPSSLHCKFSKARSCLNFGSCSYPGGATYIDLLCQEDAKINELMSWHCTLLAVWCPSMELKKNINNASPLVFRDRLIFHFFFLLSIFLCCSICQYHQN